MNLEYLIPRVVRHFLPERLTRFLLLHSVIIRPSLETSNPQAAIRQYANVLAERRDSFKDKRVLVFGYGGRFDLGMGLLEAGAAHVVLCEKFAPPDDAHNGLLLPKYDSYLFLDKGRPRPRPEWSTLLQDDIRTWQPPASFAPVDLVVSHAVYEHLDDVDGITRSLAALTGPGGSQIHFVDLRDHFFRYPFEMLAYPEDVWRGWLNPTSNHNRFRLWDYRSVFEKYFEDVKIEILERDEAAFEKARPRIRPEFVSGRIRDDSVTLILVVASRPRKQAG
jgi:hypothetical protein